MPAPDAIDVIDAPFLRLEHRTPQSAMAAHAAIAAVIAGYPLLESVRTCHVQTAPGAQGYGHAPFNVPGHSDHRWTDRDRDIVPPPPTTCSTAPPGSTCGAARW